MALSCWVSFRTSVPAATTKAAPTGGGTKRNPARQSHVITSNGHSNKDQNSMEQNGSGPYLSTTETKQQTGNLPLEKSETVSKATGAVAANTAGQAVNRRRSNVVKEVE